jgi:glycosyltransferase involved in cell wall biosynthesis
MKILHLISSCGMYGAEAVILNLLRTMQDGTNRGILGTFLNSQSPNTQLHDTAISAGIESHTIACKGRLDHSVLEGIRGLTRRMGVDVVHAHGYKADIYAYVALRGSDTSLVSTCHNWIDTDIPSRIYGTIDRRVLRNYGGVVAVSEEVKTRLLRAGIAKERVRCIRNGIDLRPFDVRRSEGPSTDQPILVGLACRLAHEKGGDLFVQMVGDVLKEFPATRFVVAGDGPDRPMLEALIKKMGIGTNIRLLGHCEDMPAFYASLDILVSPSRTEGLPMVLLEAMATRLPIVATAVGAVPSVVRDGLTGILVPANDIASLTRAVIRLLRDAGLRQQLGDAARMLIAQEFSAERMTAEYWQLYQQVVESDIGPSKRQGDDAITCHTPDIAGNC